MKRTSLRRSTGLAAVAVTLSLGLAACGDDADETASNTPETSQSAEEAPEETEEAMDAGAETFGPACDAIPKDGAGSFNGMATEPVATAASANPLLTTLVTAVGEAGLGDTLNSAEAITVFAPTNDAFGKIPEDTLNEVLADKETLTAILTHHVLGEQVGPDSLAGEFETLNGDMLTVEGSGDEYTVGDEKAAVLCGNIPTANATVYVIDTVLMP